MVSKVAEIRFPWPKRWQAWHRQENLPRKPRAYLDALGGIPGHQVQAGTSTPEPLRPYKHSDLDYYREKSKDQEKCLARPCGISCNDKNPRSPSIPELFPLGPGPLQSFTSLFSSRLILAGLTATT